MLPIGRRLAFDAAQGRLWVVCRQCEKWNLVPFESRLEAIDCCERLFRDTRTRYSTGHIGLARLPEGLELVRIGPALRPEFAAWRYGDQFGRRRRKMLLLAGAGTAASAALVVAGLTTGLFVAGGASFLQLPQLYLQYRTNMRIIGHVPLGDGRRGAITRTNLMGAEFLTDPAGALTLRLQARAGVERTRVTLRDNSARQVLLRGPALREAMRHLTPLMNGGGGAPRVVQDAVALSADASFDDLLARGGEGRWRYGRKGERTLHLLRMHGAARLALEMQLHEEKEREALAGELKLLEREWREADELARIADDLAVSDEVRGSADALGR